MTSVRPPSGQPRPTSRASGLRPGVGRTAVVLLMLAAFGISAAYGMLLLLPLYVQELGGDEASFGLVLSSAAVSAVVCLVALARHPEALRPEWVLVTAIAVFGLGAGAASQVTGGGVPLVGVGVLLGTAWATVYTVAPMVISSMVTDTGRATYFGYLTGSEQLGIGAGPVVAGLLVPTSLGFRGTFLTAGLVCVLAMAATVAVVALTPDTRAARAAASTTRDQLAMGEAVRRVLRAPTVTWIVLIALFACLFTALTQFQTTYAQAHGLDYSIFYISYTIAVIVVRFGVAPLASRFETTRVIAVSVSVMATAVGSFLLVGHHPLAYAAASAVVGFGYGLALPAVQAQAVNVSADRVRPRVLPIAGLVFQTAILTFPLAGGWMVAEHGYGLLFTVLVGFALAQAAICWWQDLARRSPAMQGRTVGP